MIWLFERGATIFQLETRYDNNVKEYVLELRGPDGPQSAERFNDAATFRARLIEIERSLEGQNWRRVGPPIVVEQGWPDRTPPR